MANKLRHIAISVRDPEAAAKFFEEAFGMTRAGNAQRGVYMTDGVFNVALLNFGDEPIAGFEGQKDVTGLIHFGMWVDSVEDPTRPSRRPAAPMSPAARKPIRTSITRSSTRRRRASSSTSPRAAGRAPSRM